MIQAQRTPRLRHEAMCAAARFGKYNLEDERAVVRPEDIKKDIVTAIFAVIGEAEMLCGRFTPEGWANFAHEGEYYDFLAERLGKIGYGADEAMRISVEIGERGGGVKREHFGIIMSAVVSGCRDGDVTITNTGIRNADNFGFMNRKNLRIIGDVGNLLGNRMEGGRIEVDGNAGEILGLMMSGGEIIVKGDVKGITGGTSGVIRVQGELGGISMDEYSWATLIYHKGEIIYGWDF